MERTHADARAGIPMVPEQVRAVIAKLERECKSKGARKKMAEMGVKSGVVTDEARKVWADYLATFK